MKVYAIVCEYGAVAIHSGIEMICKTREIAESWYNNHDFAGRQYDIEEMEIIDTMWEKPQPKPRKKRTKK